jgi:protein ImuB
VRVQAFCSDGRVEVVEVGLARPAADPARIRPLLWLKLDRIDPGFGIDCLRLEAVETEPVHATQHSGHQDAAAAAGAHRSGDMALSDLLGKLGARLGLDAVTRLHPAESHIPEKSVQVLTAAWSAPAPGPWPAPRAPRPLLLFRPEPVTAPEEPQVPQHFRWRRRDLRVLTATGPERIAPEWWLDDPDWRSGPRDYWRVVTDTGDRLWLFFAHGADLSPGWFCHGQFG